MSKIQNSVVVNDNIMYALMENDFIKLETNIKALFASIPYNLFTNNKMYAYEGYYVSVFYAYIKALGFDLIGEDVTNKGRIDLTIILPQSIFIIEFKTDGTSALQQIKDKKYHEKYMNKNKNIYILGIAFDTVNRNISNVQYEKINLKKNLDSSC
nr:PD-(D/E)XK nuclease domain-containing protein [Sulfurimonas sp. SAG-AH-194-I05]